MLMRTLELPVDRSTVYTGFSDECADWLKPYLAAAMRCGIVQGYPAETGAVFCPDREITGSEAAMMVSNALNLPAPADTKTEESIPVWAVSSWTAAADQGLILPAQGSLTRADAAKVLYQVSRMAHADFSPIFDL